MSYYYPNKDEILHSSEYVEFAPKMDISSYISALASFFI